MTAPAIAMPERIARRPRYGTVPTLFTTFIKPDGTPDFRVSDPGRCYEAYQKRLCGICGEPMKGAVVWFGRKELICDVRLFGEPGMHEDCCRYALAVCPFLIGKTQRRDAGLPASAIHDFDDVHAVRRTPALALYLGWYRAYTLALRRGIWYAQASRCLRWEAVS